MMKTRQDKIINIISHVVMITLSLSALLPFWLIIASSLTANSELVNEGYKFIPNQLSLDAYRYIFAQWDVIGRAYVITIIVTLIGTTASLFLSSTIGFALTQKNIPGINVVMFLVFFTMLFSGGIVSQFIVYTSIVPVRNTIFALIVPNLLLGAFSVILVRNYMVNNIPSAITEAAEIDGAGIFRIYWQFALPLSKPILATMGLLAAISYWNDWVNGLYFVTDSKLYTIQLLLNNIQNNLTFFATQSDYLIGSTAQVDIPTVSMRMGIAAVAMLPILILYPFFQKHFAHGIVLGGVKG